ncbi:hypothetical protein, partial [Bartonella sp. CL41QHWL]|uniref:hypothetical protein n=1 Tax=Bartonella sp. CL41QHWL TaxID=3243527 RepID=UPI0035CEE20F
KVHHSKISLGLAYTSNYAKWRMSCDMKPIVLLVAVIGVVVSQTIGDEIMKRGEYHNIFSRKIRPLWKFRMF